MRYRHGDEKCFKTFALRHYFDIGSSSGWEYWVLFCSAWFFLLLYNSLARRRLNQMTDFFNINASTKEDNFLYVDLRASPFLTATDTVCDRAFMKSDQISIWWVVAMVKYWPSSSFWCFHNSCKFFLQEYCEIQFKFMLLLEANQRPPQTSLIRAKPISARV